jgi:MFS family permease
VQVREELDIALGDIGILVAAYFFASAVFSSPGGRLVERIGAGAGMRLSSLLASTCLLGVAVSHSFVLTLVLLIFGGASNALGQVGANRFIADRTPRSRQAFAFGIKQSGIPASTLLAGLAVPTIALTVGWRWAFVGAALLSLIVAVIIPDANLRSANWLDQPGRAESSLRALMVLAIAGAFGSGAANALGAYLVDSGVAAGFGEGAAGALFALGSLVGLSTRIGAGWLADRATGGRLVWVGGMFGVGAVGYLLLATGDRPLFAAGTLLCFAGGWGWPGLFQFSIVTRNRMAPAAATGVTQTGVYFGGMAGPLWFGQVAEQASYEIAWTIAAIAAVLATIAIALGRWLLLKDPIASSGDAVRR